MAGRFQHLFVRLFCHRLIPCCCRPVQGCFTEGAPCSASSVTGEEACEGRGHTVTQCAAVGCCNYSNGTCHSDIGANICGGVKLPGTCVDTGSHGHSHGGPHLICEPHANPWMTVAGLASRCPAEFVSCQRTSGGGVGPSACSLELASSLQAPLSGLDSLDTQLQALLFCGFVMLGPGDGKGPGGTSSINAAAFYCASPEIGRMERAALQPYCQVHLLFYRLSRCQHLL